VAAAFRTRIDHDGNSEVAEWRYWRSANRVQRDDLQSQTGEIWQRDGATVFHTLLFHADRRGVEFEQADLRMTGGGFCLGAADADSESRPSSSDFAPRGRAG
jgi:hypothetical protein